MHSCLVEILQIDGISKMDFGLMTLEALAGPEGEGGGSSKASDPETKLKGLGSELFEQEDSGAGEDDWKSSKMAKSDSLSSHKPMPLYHGSPLLRSNAFSTGDGRKEEHTLSFSSVKSEVPFLRKDGRIVTHACGSGISSLQC